jgi:predicted ATPase/class 3 adenylate cyclase
MPVCAQCDTDNPEIAKFCLACGAPLAAAPPPQEFRKTVTIVFSDLKGSTSLGERLDSESLREVMTRYFDAMRAELERHGGLIEKFIGDAVMAVFGLPKLHEDDALRAVRAAFGMQRALGELNDELEHHWGVRLANRTGVNTGEVVSGDPTTGQRLVTGDAVNVAARLEQAAGEREVLLGELTYQLVRDAVEVEEVEPLELKGKSERVPAYRLVSVAETGEGWARRGDAPMVGREAELALLVSTFDEAVAQRSCRLVTVVGDAGVGKSRLNDEFIQRVGGRAHVLRGRCLSYGEGITFWPLVEAVRQAAAIREDDSPATALSKLSELAGPENQQVVDRVAAAIGLSVEHFPIDELFWGARKLVETLGREKPLVVLFDDIHWAEPTFLDLIEHLLDAVQDAPVLLLCPARHELLEERAEWAERPGTARVILEPLTSADIEAIVENLLGEAGIADDARARIVAAADGNPLFVEQMLSMLIDDGSLRFEDGRWASALDADELSVPPTIHALLSSRLDNLAPDERAVIEPASVIGQVFPELAVQELTRDTVRDRVPEHLTNLTRKHLVRKDLSAIDEARFRFDHVLIREAAYNGLLKRARATLHERFVTWADRVNRERGREIEYEEILGYHLEQAYHYLSELGPVDDHGHELGRDGSHRLASAGHRARSRGDVAATANLLERAAALLPELDSERLALLPELGEALIDVGRFSEAEAVLDEAHSRARAVGERPIETDAILRRLLLELRTGDAEDWSKTAVPRIEQAIEAFTELDDHAGLARSYRLLGYVYGTACKYGEAAEACERALEHARQAGDTEEERTNATGYALALCWGPTPVDDARERIEAILDDVASSRTSRGWVLCLLAHLHAMKGEFDVARALHEEGRAAMEEMGKGWLVAWTALSTGRIELLARGPGAAEQELRRAFDLLDAMGESYLRSTVAALLARIVFEQDRPDEAEDLAYEAERLAGSDDVETQVAWRTVRALVLARSGASMEAQRLGREALELLETTDSAVLKVEVLADLSEVFDDVSNPTRAWALNRAIEVANLKGNIAALEQLRLALDRPARRTGPERTAV